MLNSSISTFLSWAHLKRIILLLKCRHEAAAGVEGVTLISACGAKQCTYAALQTSAMAACLKCGVYRELASSPETRAHIWPRLIVTEHWPTQRNENNIIHSSHSLWGASTVRQRAGLKLASWDQLHHLSVKKKKKKKKDVSITHVAVIKRLSPRSASTGSLLHLSLIWLLALIWGNASLTGIQSSLCMRSLSTAAAAAKPGQSTSALCEEPGEETLSDKVSVRTNASFSHRLGLAPPLSRPRIPPSLSLSAW